MKTNSWMVSALLLLTLPAGAQAPVDKRTESTEPVVVEIGPHHRVWERTITETLPDGTVAERKSAYTELATGMNFKNERGEWIESREEVEIFQGSAVARQGQHQVIFAANLNSQGAIDLLAPDGKRFRSHLLGLAYTDYASGKSVMIADVKDSIGAVLPPNQVIYQDAFAGDCAADVRFTYTIGGFEQDVVLLTAPPPPAAYGLNEQTVRAEVWTEFIELPEGTATPVVLKQENDPVLRQQMAEPDLIDQRLDFGIMKMEQGQAFPLGDTDPFGGASVPTGKSIEKIDGRVYLIEKVDYRDIREHLKALPQQAAVKPLRKVIDPVKGQRMFAGMVPPAPKGERGAWRANQVAKLDANRKGFVLDYVTLNGSITNYVFKGDSTFYVTNTVNLYGTTVIEGGAVVKGGGLAIRGPLDCRTTSYRPATWTAKDDNSIGETISGSTGSPSGYYGTMLNLYDTSATCDLHDFRMSYATYGIIANAGVKTDLSHFQIVKSQNAVGLVTTSSANCRNFLFYNVSSRAFPITGTVTNRSEHGTFHVVANFRQTTNAASPFGLTNCLLISVTNNVLYTGTNVVSSLDDTGFFQTVGASSHYLSNGSTNRNAGTTNLNPTLLADLKKRTTYPAIVLSNHITSDTTLTAQAQRDTDTPDLGFHFDPLDFVASQIAITNATLTVSAGTAIGVYGASGTHGLQLLEGATMLAEGTPLYPCRFVRYNLVQEQASTNWSAASAGWGIVHSSDAAPSARANFRFTEWSAPPAAADHVQCGGTSGGTNWFKFRDCSFFNGGVYILAPRVAFTNCLLHRSPVLVYGDASETRHCLFVGGSFYVDGTFGSHNVFDTFFDRTYFDTNSWFGTVNHYNGYISNENHLAPEGTNNVVVTDMVYQAGPLGLFYQPANSFLINTGSVSAASAGLYHFTTTTNQVAETNSVVDIGLHYAAVNSSGQAIDTDGDGLADYFEDSDGDGTADSGEASWLVTDTDGDGVSDYLETLLGRSPIVAGTTNDVNGVLNLRLYTPLK